MKVFGSRFRFSKAVQGLGLRDFRMLLNRADRDLFERLS